MKNKNTQNSFPKLDADAPKCGLRKRPFKAWDFAEFPELDPARTNCRNITRSPTERK